MTPCPAAGFIQKVRTIPRSGMDLATINGLAVGQTERRTFNGDPPPSIWTTAPIDAYFGDPSRVPRPASWCQCRSFVGMGDTTRAPTATSPGHGRGLRLDG
jgi:hypothetical protein